MECATKGHLNSLDGPSIFELLEPDSSVQLEKMSKSRGNVITIDEIVNKVAFLDTDFEFRDYDGVKINNFHKLNVWRARNDDGNFYAGTQFNRAAKELIGLEKLPIFLHFCGNPIPCRLMINNKEMMQHQTLYGFWDRLSERFPDEFYEIEQEEHRSDYQLAGVYSKIG